MNNQEWLNWRNEGIGSSDAPVIMGVSPWKSKSSLLDEKINKKTTIETDAMAHGKRMEPLALKWFENKMGTVLFSNCRFENAKDPWRRATIDGIDLDKNVMVEVKCPYNLVHHQEVVTTKKIPDIYFPQVQHQMEVLGMKNMYFMSFDGKDGVILEIERDDHYIDQLIKEEQDFWNKVLAKESYEIQREGEWIEVATKRYQIQKQMKQLKDEDERLYEDLVRMSEDKSSKGGGYKFTRSEKSGSIDYSLVPQLLGVDLEPYRKKSFTQWRLSAI